MILDIILIEDLKIGGFTSYSKQFPNIVAEGETLDLAISALIDLTETVLKTYGKAN